jgi:hypothetical protein
MFFEPLPKADDNWGLQLVTQMHDTDSRDLRRLCSYDHHGPTHEQERRDSCDGNQPD